MMESHQVGVLFVFTGYGVRGFRFPEEGGAEDAAMKWIAMTHAACNHSP